ncbi:FecCD family ABC transporter permease [Tepidibacter hydrothermalis]|uniref:Iron ABC transporter permease n=1 Tax=Tepidibacter hydrothermalis TaxID=3036126 RepID=A0ABY8E9U6_9FIRM|nr:iron ABC transporter permease [Tepidibacter hydrothermalis]WFD09713.1 iron ABC transporter permease [Tepidibacter hydrothermalis]
MKCKHICITIIIIFVSFIFSLGIGRYPISINDILNNDIKAMSVFLQLRLPRVLAAFLIGSALACSGACFQGIFKNPLVSPNILGAASGASFGVALAILFSFKIQYIQLTAFCFGLLAVFMTLMMSRNIPRHDPSLSLVLSGMLVQGLFSALVSLIKYVCDPYEKLPTITFWLMGGLGNISLNDLIPLGSILTLAMIPLILLRWKMNILALPEEEAIALGVNTKFLRRIIIICATLLSSCVVSFAGVIGWVGLVVPHMVRIMVGSNYKLVIPFSIMIGGVYLLIVDDIARSAVAFEIPLGIITSLFGIPFFAYLLIKGRKGWS